MKSKTLLFGAILATSVSMNAQFTSGVVPLGTTGMTVKLDTTPTQVTITLTGPSNTYLGIGSGDEGMAEGADGFIYNNTPNRDYTFNGIGVPPDPDASQDWTIVSETVSGTTRTVVAHRTLAGGAGDVLIPNAAGPMQIFYAKGGSLTIAQHSGSNRGYATLTMTPLLGVADVDSAKAFMIYPNPVKEVINFKNVENIDAVSIMDQSGRMVVPKTAIQQSMNVSRLKPGVYFVEVLDKSGNTTYQKIIKN